MSYLQPSNGLAELNIDYPAAYSRPTVKSKTIFGSLLPFGKRWRTGALDATILTMTDPITIEGKPLPVDSYSLFSTPTATEWTSMLSSHVSGHSTQGYDEKNDVLRFTVKFNPFYESFPINLQDVVRNQAVPYLNWASTVVHLSIVNNADVRITADIQKRIESATGEQPGFIFQLTHYLSSRKRTPNR